MIDEYLYNISYEEAKRLKDKADAYDKALDRAKVYYNNELSNALTPIDLEVIFPEIADSKDEKIKKRLYTLINDIKDDLLKKYLLTKEDVLSWIEKHGNSTIKEQNNFKPKFKAGDTIRLIEYPDCHINIRRIEDGFYKCDKDCIPITDQYKYELYAEEKTLFIPKFKEGDWVVYMGTTAKILDLQKHCYVGKDINDKDFVVSYCNENEMKKWTIADARNGDVLVTTFDEDNMIIMYHSMCTVDTINVHCCLDNKFVCWNLGTFNAEDVEPASRKEREILFTEMKEAGYEWNFGKIQPIH